MMSGRNSPVGPLSILSGRNSPASQRAGSPAGSIRNFQFEDNLLTKDYEIEGESKTESESKPECENKDVDESKSDEAKPIVSPEDKVPEVILTEEDVKKPVDFAKEEACQVIGEKALWEKEIIVPENDQENAPKPVNGH